MVWVKGHQLQNGKYVIQEVLGQGGFGITYKALHVPLNYYVVVKTPNEYLKYNTDYEKYVDKFIKEGKTLAKLSKNSHPHIVRVQDLFQEQDTYCLIMDFVDGENLFQLVKRQGRILEEKAVKYIQQIGSALSTIHKAGLVHRDAHPGNIMINKNGKAILIDFGIAKELVPTTQSSTGNAGNKVFAPYEQLYQCSREPNLDIYCLAATFYFILTGKYPTNCVNRKLDKIRLISPKEIIFTISNIVNEAILIGMALEPENRPQTMQEWLEILLPSSIVKPSNLPVSPSSETADSVSYSQIRQDESQIGRTNTKRTRKIPWGSLITVIFIYAFISRMLTISQANIEIWLPFWVGAVMIAIAVVGDVLVAGAVAVVLAGIWTGTGAIALTWFWAMAWAVAVTVSVAVANNRLKAELFSTRDRCLLLLITTSLGIVISHTYFSLI